MDLEKKFQTCFSIPSLLSNYDLVDLSNDVSDMNPHLESLGLNLSLKAMPPSGKLIQVRSQVM
jgi:hypothetical protein